MNTILITMGMAILAGVSLIVGLGSLSLLSGALHFLFARPRLTILKSEKGDNGFAFAFSWNSSREKVKFDRVRLRLYNAFGSPKQVDLFKEFNPEDESFATDVDMGKAYAEFISAKGFEDALVEVEVQSTKGLVTHYFRMRGSQFLGKLQNTGQTARDHKFSNKKPLEKPKYHSVSKSFIAEPSPATTGFGSLKIASNPEFAGEFTAGAGDAGAAGAENFSVSKVWIEDGCIVCNACEDIYEDVFEVKEDACIIRPGAPTDNGLLIQEAADACPVEIIKFTKVS